MIPTLKNYGNYKSENYGFHSIMMTIGQLELYFSYKTIIAFFTPKTGTIVSENLWGKTTGKHLNWIDGGNKERRMNREEFEKKLEEMISHGNIK